MADLVPDPELLRSLGRLVRGLSALFWGLPAALIVCAGTATAGWFGTYGFVPALAATGLLLFGLGQLGSFQKQERPWRTALDRTLLLALINAGLSPFLYWWNRVPDKPFFAVTIGIFGITALLFLVQLNVVLRRLGAMLPDEALRHETRQFTALNCALLFVTLAIVLTAFASQLVFIFNLLPFQIRSPADFLALPIRSGPWPFFLTVLLPLAILVLLPLAMTMALLWKTKEVILDSVFGGPGR